MEKTLIVLEKNLNPTGKYSMDYDFLRGLFKNEKLPIDIVMTNDPFSSKITKKTKTYERIFIVSEKSKRHPGERFRYLDDFNAVIDYGSSIRLNDFGVNVCFGGEHFKYFKSLHEAFVSATFS